MRLLLSLVILCALVRVAVAQQEPKECTLQLSEAQIALELLERTSKADRTQAAADLVRWIQRAQAAEKQLAQALKPLTPPEGTPQPPGPAAPKPSGQP